MPALMRPNPVRANLQAGGNVYAGDSWPRLAHSETAI